MANDVEDVVCGMEVSTDNVTYDATDAEVT